MHDFLSLCLLSVHNSTFIGIVIGKRLEENSCSEPFGKTAEVRGEGGRGLS